MILKNRNFFSKTTRSKVTDYAALTSQQVIRGHIEIDYSHLALNDHTPLVLLEGIIVHIPNMTLFIFLHVIIKDAFLTLLRQAAIVNLPLYGMCA